MEKIGVACDLSSGSRATATHGLVCAFSLALDVAMTSDTRVGEQLTVDVESQVDAARRGDRAALEAIAREQLPRVERTLIKLLGPRDDLDDLVQNVFVELCRALPRFRGDSQLSSFVGGITVRVARRAMRPSAWFRRRVHVELEAVAPDVGIERRTDAQEGLRRVRAALEGVAPKKRIAFLLWALDGKTPDEIAELTNASVSATRSRIFYARKELAKRAAQDPVLRELIGDLT